MTVQAELERGWRAEHAPEESSSDLSPLPEPERLLVVREDRLGDLVVSLPAVHQLRRLYPNAELALLVQPALRPLAESIPGVTQVLVAEGRFADRVERLRRFNPQIAVAISRGAATALQLYRAGIPHRVGTGRRWFSPLFTRLVDGSRRSGGGHEVDYALQFARAVGATAAGCRFDIEIDPEWSRFAASWLRQNSIGATPLMLHPGSGGSCPAWPVERWAELIQLLQRRDESFLVTAGPADAAIIATLRDAVAPFPLFEGELMQLAALLARASGVVSNSTGPIHLAAALGRPTLAIHAPWTSCAAARWAPYDRRGFALVVGAEIARGWSRRQRQRNGAALLAQLEAAQLLERIDQLMTTGGGWIERSAGVH